MSTSERVKQGGPDDALSYTVAEEPPSTVQEMREYLDTLMLEFHDQPVVRRHLSEIMEDYKAHRIDGHGIIKRVTQLFNSHVELNGRLVDLLAQRYPSRDATTATPPPLLYELFPSRPKSTTHFLVGLGTSQSYRPLPINEAPSSGLSRATRFNRGAGFLSNARARCDAATYNAIFDALTQYTKNLTVIGPQESPISASSLNSFYKDCREHYRLKPTTIKGLGFCTSFSFTELDSTPNSVISTEHILQSVH